MLHWVPRLGADKIRDIIGEMKPHDQSNLGRKGLIKIHFHNTVYQMKSEQKYKHAKNLEQ